MDVPSEHPGDHGVDENRCALFTDPTRGELKDGFVHPVRLRSGERFAKYPKAAGEGKNRAFQEPDGAGRKEMKLAGSVEEAVGCGLVGLLDLILEAQSANQGRCGGDVIEVAVRAHFDSETFDPVRPDVPPGPTRSLQDQDLQPTGYL